MAVDHGGPVYPRSSVTGPMRGGAEGVTYRNMVAVEAMKVYMAMFSKSPHVVGTPAFMESIARVSFQMADRMVAQSRRQ